MDPIKEAFSRAKQDIADLKAQITSISQQLEEIKRTFSQESNTQTNQQTDSSENPAFQHINPTHKMAFPQDWPLKALKSPILNLSTGNEGVPTDRQTDQQTDRQTPFLQQIPSQANDFTQKNDKIGNIERVSQVLESLDSIKKDLRHQFKRLTPQEMAIFSTIYLLEEEGFTVDYLLISRKLNLSESSIRDYTLKIIKKGIPLTKTKQNNKKIILSIPPNLKAMASLPAILALREL